MATFTLQQPTVCLLGDDPPRTHRINADSYQQHALLTVDGWQYAAFYRSKDDAAKGGVCLVTLARRELRRGPTEKDAEWEYLAFDDYEQTVDDGHNTISIGVCTGDGTVHVSFDHHCDELRYRCSVQGLATNPSKHKWEQSLFTKTSNTLPGLAPTKIMEEVTYPRFVTVEDDMLLTYRIGQAGSGSDVLYRYSSADHAYTFLGTLLTGEGNSPYINGMDYRAGLIHVSWTYRRFIEYEGVHDATSTAHKAQAGPNGPENNYSLCYMCSDYKRDKGLSWDDSEGRGIANLSLKEAPNTVRPSTEGITVFDMATNSGILNQEGQAAAPDGGFHVLNREKVKGVETWMVYSRSRFGSWKRTAVLGLRPTETGSRGSICADRASNLYAVLPGNTDSSLSVVRALKADGYAQFELVWKGEGYDGEPLVDQARLDGSNVLSAFTRTDKDESGRRRVVVLDFELGGAGALR